MPSGKQDCEYATVERNNPIEIVISVFMLWLVNYWIDFYLIMPCNGCANALLLSLFLSRLNVLHLSSQNSLISSLHLPYQIYEVNLLNAALSIGSFVLYASINHAKRILDRFTDFYPAFFYTHSLQVCGSKAA